MVTRSWLRAIGQISLVTLPAVIAPAALAAAPVKPSVAADRTAVVSDATGSPATGDAAPDLGAAPGAGTVAAGTKEPPPVVERIECVTRCEPRQSDGARVAVKRHAVLRIEGDNLARTKRVVFLGTSRTRDNVNRRPARAGAGEVLVRVPSPASSGAVRLHRADGERSYPSEQSVRVLAPGPVFMKPVNGPVSSRFGWRWGRAHQGIDLSASTGTTIRATAEGKVVQAGWYGGYGRFVCIRHSNLERAGRRMDVATSCYAHLSAVSTRKGRTVGQGQPIGRVGCTGHCTGPHLHFEIRRKGRARDPLPYFKMRTLT